MTTLTYATTTLTLPEAVLWSDEHDWQPVAERREYSITGALIVEQAVRQSGRPITLRGWWLPRSQLDTIKAWSELPAVTLTLVLRGVSRSVRFDQLAQAVEAAPIFNLQDPDAGTLYSVTCRFLAL
jgi:hypothetical protein